jgi:uncharacterized membrane protein YhhN
MARAALLAFLALAAVDWVAVVVRARRVEWAAKPAALAALIVHAAAGGQASGWLLAALVLSLAGDVLLMLPANLFAPGLGAFLLAHLAYVGAFTAPTGSRLAWLAAVLLVTAPLALRIVGAVPRPALRAAVGVYVLTIATMVGSALASGRPVAALGAALFLASDSLIAWNRFVRPLAWAPAAIMVTYHLGQLGLVRGLLA